MARRATDPAYLKYQYDDTEKLRIRAETHRLYGERPDDWLEWEIGHLDPRPGQLVLDVGCGYGWVHPAIADLGARVIGLDRSRGMVEATAHAAREKALPVRAVQGDAVALPLADASCDRVLAGHMLFHVPEPPAALREMRRVLRPGGRVVLTTNAADHSRRLYDVHAEAARALGYTPTPGGYHFSLDDLALVRSVFPTAERHVRADAFIFPTVGVVLCFYATGRVDAIEEAHEDGEHRPRLIEAVGERVAAIIADEGVFRVEKDAGCFVADV
jgi:ubiquinone/menaquinone biosynthesis C-methylase UbiE